MHHALDKLEQAIVIQSLMGSAMRFRQPERGYTNTGKYADQHACFHLNANACLIDLCRHVMHEAQALSCYDLQGC